MKLQKIFKESYCHRLKSNISPEAYAQDIFDYDPTQTMILANVYQPENLAEKLNTNRDDFESAKAIYEAYESLSPLVASKEEFWAYLTHVDLFQYNQERWNNPQIGYDVKHGNVTADYILDHWFFSPNGMMRTSLMNMWWSIYLSIDETKTGEERYDLSKILFVQNNFRTIRFGTSTLFRHKEAVIGILQFLKDNPKVYQENFRGRSIYISKYFNRLGGVRSLVYLDRDFFRKELEKKKDILLSISSTEEVTNNEKILTL